MKVFLHSDDINLLTHWEKSLNKKCNIIEEYQELTEIKESIIVINYSAFQQINQDIINDLKKENNSILVLHRSPSLEVAKKLLSFGVSGYGNALMRDHFLLSAVDAISEGLIWLHPEFTSQLISEIPNSHEKDISDLLNLLSVREKEVAGLLKDGDTYKNIALKLGVTPRTIKAHASSIYTKLHVKDRLSLALLLK